MNLLVASILALGFLPSFTALSQGYLSAYPALGSIIGPLSFLKIGAPILVLYFWQRRETLPQRTIGWISLALVIGTPFAIHAYWQVLNCDPPGGTNTLREWFVILLGFVSALCFWSLPTSYSRAVASFWLATTLGFAVLDAISPDANNWFLQNLFDPQTRALDAGETGARPLAGLFGRQSLAKLLSWTPWLVLAFTAISRPRKARRRWILSGVAAVISTGLILATTQRGPLVGALIGWFALGAHAAVQLKQKWVLKAAAGAVLLAISITAVAVPRSVLEPRVRSMLGLQSLSPAGEVADNNRAFRLTMALFSLKVSWENPLGQACITPHQFMKGGIINHYSHAHNMLIQQYRERGWLWGTLHLVLWLFAWISAWRMKSLLGSCIFAGITAIQIAGLFDHPWFVLNHSMLLWTFILAGLGFGQIRATKSSTV